MKMTPAHELSPLLDRLIAGWESEVVEFKNVSDSFSTSDIGKYFSALANEANLRNLDRAWLIFGVDDKARQVVGSTYRADTKAAYIKTRALHDDYYRKLVTEYLEKFGSATRQDINELLLDKLSSAFDDDQRETKIWQLADVTARKRDDHQSWDTENTTLAARGKK